MMYRVKFIEKVFYIFITVMAFFLYKNPSLMQRIIMDNAVYSITGFAVIVLIFNYSVWYFDKQHKISESRTRKLKAEQKDIKL